MKILLVYPECPPTFWSFKYALKFIARKAAYPPLGLMTVAAMLPSGWERKLVDLNVGKLRDRDILWADYVFISAMMVQDVSVKEVLCRCKKLGRRVVAGGPLFTAGYAEYEGLVEHFVLNEAEITLPQFLQDLQGGTPKHIYTSLDAADMKKSPLPDRSLISKRHYGSMNIQYSRGCPFDCEFCNITSLFGRVPRTKTVEQLLAELDGIHALGWKGSVFIVDDNFIGNKRKLKDEVLPAIIGWMDSKKRPFTFITEASLNLSDDEELMEMMVRAGFDTVFIGIESPNAESLEECSKIANRNRDMVASVRKLQQSGLEVQGGFIVGFDRDPEQIFEMMIDFVQNSYIVTAMVGLLHALPDTRLYRRLKEEGRLLKEASGNNTDILINFVPTMDIKELVEGYKRVIGNIYSPKQFYRRARRFLREYRPSKGMHFHIRFNYLMALFKSILYIGILGRERFHYWGLVVWTLFRRPGMFHHAITLSIYGHHFRKVFKKTVLSC